jgi:UDP-N-acetylmuramoylalanine--D-glutamate ligase
MPNDERRMTKALQDLGGQKVVVLGLARQGLALSRWLVAQGAQVTASDVKPAAALSDAIPSLAGLPIQLELGGHPMSLLERCDRLCLSGGVPIDLPIVVEAGRRGIPLTNDAQLFIERCPARVIGITGSAGKTTTTALVGAMGRSAGWATWVGGNIGHPLIGDLDSMKESDCVVMELSSFQLEIMTSSPSIAAVLNVTPNHLDRHPSMEAYIAAKAHILDYQSRDDAAVLGYDDPVARSLASRVRGKLWFFAGDCPLRSASGMFESHLPHCCVKDGHVVLMRDDEVQVCAVNDIRLRGEHNVLNVLAACALASQADISVEAMRSAIAAFTGVAHRLQFVRELNGVSYYDDSIATAPERVIAALKSFHEPIVLLAGGRDKHLPWSDAAELITRRVRRLIVFGEMAELVERAVSASAAVSSAPLRASSRITSRAQTASQTLKGVQRVESLAEAVKRAAEVARPGDVVLLSPGGTSFDAFKDFAERGDKFQEFVRAL